MRAIILVFLLCGLISPDVRGDIRIGNFDADEDGWELTGDSNGANYRSLERIEDQGVGWLRLNYAPTTEDPDEYGGWAALVKTWDSSGQENVKTLSFSIESGRPWVVQVFASFGELGEKSSWVHWPKDMVELRAKDFQVTDDDFNKISGLRLVMDGNSATNGGGRDGQPAMWFSISDVRLDGSLNASAPKPKTQSTQSTGKPKLILSDWEDGSVQGWKLVGDALNGQGISANDPAGDRVFRLEVGAAENPAPGKDGSYGLRLVYRSAQGKWAGMLFSTKEIKIKGANELSFDIKNVDNVKRVFVFAATSDAEWRAAEISVSPDGENKAWQHIALPSTAFMRVDGKPGQLDLNKLEYVRFSFDGGQKIDASNPNASFMIDNLAVNGEPAVDLTSGEAVNTDAIEVPKWVGPSVNIGILDTSVFPLVGQVPGFVAQVESALKASGATVEKIAPRDLSSKLAGGGIGVLVVNGPAFPYGSADSVINYLKKGGAIWLVGSPDILSKPMVEGSDGQWAPSEKPDAPEELRRILEGVQLQRGLFEFASREMRLTPEGQKWWPFLPVKLPQVSCSFLAVDDSIDYATTPPWVTAVPLLQVKYSKKNWVFQDDIFTGWPLVLFKHEGGLFRGARVLFSGIAGGQGSVLNPQHPHFAQTVVSAVSHLAEPVTSLTDKTWQPPAILSSLPKPSRANFFNYPGPLFLPLAFQALDHVRTTTYWDDFDQAGFTSAFSGIPWKAGEKVPEDVVDWNGMDELVSAAKAHGTTIVFDPYSFAPQVFSGWTDDHSVYSTLFRDRFAVVMKEVARRYKDEPTVIALFATPNTDIAEFKVSDSASAREAWTEYVKSVLNLSLEQAALRYGQAMTSWSDLPLPSNLPDKPLNISPLWADYLKFYIASYHEFIQTAIDAVRSETPDMPILLRGSYLNSAVNMSLASRNPNVGVHAECIETTVDVEGYFRGMGLRFGVPLSAENGWPKVKGGPLRMAFASFLMGNYTDFCYSFDGPTWIRPALDDLHLTEEITTKIRQAGAKYQNSDLALLIPDTTLYVSRPANHMGIEKSPHVEFLMERLGYSFEAISPQFPKFDGLRVIMDDGNNRVFTPAFRDELAAWVRAGGILVGFPTTGQYMLDASAGSLANKLGIALDCPAGQSFKSYTVGKGQVIVLPRVPNGDAKEDAKVLSDVLNTVKAQRDVIPDPDISIAYLKGKEKSYLVFYNKSKGHVGAFFTESSLARFEASMPSVNLTLTPNFKFSSAYDLVGKRNLTINNGTIKVEVPATHFGVIELTNAN